MTKSITFIDDGLIIAAVVDRVHVTSVGTGQRIIATGDSKNIQLLVVIAIAVNKHIACPRSCRLYPSIGGVMAVADTARLTGVLIMFSAFEVTSIRKDGVNAVSVNVVLAPMGMLMIAPSIVLSVSATAKLAERLFSSGTANTEE